MTFVTTPEAEQQHLAWPKIPAGMNAIQIIAIARMVERVCGTAAAASYLAEAAAAFNKKPASANPGYGAVYTGLSDEPRIEDDPTSPRRHARRS